LVNVISLRPDPVADADAVHARVLVSVSRTGIAAIVPRQKYRDFQAQFAFKAGDDVGAAFHGVPIGTI
jgi:hypothetical protein